MYIAAFVFAPLAAPEPAPGSDFSPLPLDLTAVASPEISSKTAQFSSLGSFRNQSVNLTTNFRQQFVALS